VIKCTDVFSEISDFLDGSLDEAAKQELREHLKKCHKCKVIVDTCQKTIELYCDGELFPLPQPVRERLHETLRRECQGHPK
jgi:anti-sigma factor RsiW